MDAELIGWLVVIAFWFISSIVQQIRKMGKGQPPAAPGTFDSNPEEVSMPRPGREPGPRERPRRERPRQPGSRQPGSRQPGPPPQLPPPTLADAPDPVRELLRQLGVDPGPQPSESPVTSEHRQTPGEHRQEASELMQTAGEALITASEHRQTASEIRFTGSEHRQDLSETRGTLSEHTRGDVAVRPRLRSAATGVARRGPSAVTRGLRRDLRGGQTALQRAFVLKEVLDKPIGLRTEAGSEGPGG